MNTTEKTVEPLPCPFCACALDTNRRGNNPRHPDSDCFLSGQVIHVSQLAAWNTRASPPPGNREAVLEEALACQPSTAENPNESDHQRGRFDGIIEYGRAIAALKTTPNTTTAKCSTCGATDPADNEFCSNDFHAPNTTTADHGGEAEFSIDERGDDMLIAERHWQFGWRCIARRPKLLTNDEWRPDADRIIAALSTRHDTEGAGQ